MICIYIEKCKSNNWDENKKTKTNFGNIIVSKEQGGFLITVMNWRHYADLEMKYYLRKKKVYS